MWCTLHSVSVIVCCVFIDLLCATGAFCRSSASAPSPDPQLVAKVDELTQASWGLRWGDDGLISTGPNQSDRDCLPIRTLHETRAVTALVKSRLQYDKFP